MPTMGKSLHYLDVGSGFPLLLGHSYLFDLNMWAPQFEALAKRYRLIVPDLWGHGDSPALPAGRNSLSDIAADHLALMDHLDIEEFGIVGLSVGGMWGAELAALAPERVKVLALMDSYWATKRRRRGSAIWACWPPLNRPAPSLRRCWNISPRSFIPTRCPMRCRSHCWPICKACPPIACARASCHWAG